MRYYKRTDVGHICNIPIGQVRILVFEKDLEMARNIMSSTAETKDNDNN